MGEHGRLPVAPGGYHHHIGLNTWESRNGPPPAPGTTGLYHVAIRYPDRAALAEALRRLIDARVPLEGASDHGVSEALYLRDPDGNGLELYRDRPREEWPRAADGSVRMTTARARRGRAARGSAAPEGRAAGGRRAADGRRDARRLIDLRTRLLALHKALLDDAKSAYEMDRGRIASAGALLQLVIHDPWFAWLHQLSELVVRIDEMTAAGREGAGTRTAEGRARSGRSAADCRPKRASRSRGATSRRFSGSRRWSWRTAT